ncbi:MAG: peptidoglycan DD-metalloendopeptidase family protein [Acidimicrobiales bacterium]
MRYTPRRSALVAAVVSSLLGLLGLLVLAPVARADEATTTTTTAEPTTTTTTPTSTDPSTTPSSDPTSDSTDTTLPPDGQPPSQQTDDDLAGRGFYASQGTFDPASKAGLASEVARAQREQHTIDLQLGAADAELAAAQQDALAVAADLTRLEAGQQQAVKEAADAKLLFEQRAVAAYMGGRVSESFALLNSSSPNDYANRNVMLSAVLDRDVAAATDYVAKRDALSDELQATLGRVAEVNQRLENAKAVQYAATLVSQAADWQMRTALNNSHVFIPGYVFPVAGPVQFVDSFGYPRLVGTGQQHWHEGCDVMSPMGTPLVAAEDGIVTKVGENSLGGLSLKITGTSGYWHYYAHLSGFAPGLVEGQPIKAGTLVGFVGNTGDAAGGPTHLHYEIHQPDGTVLDSFGLLETAWQARQAQLQLGGTSPMTPPDFALDPGGIGGFPRFPDGRPIYTTPEGQAKADAVAAAAGLVFELPPPVGPPAPPN